MKPLMNILAFKLSLPTHDVRWDNCLPPEQKRASRQPIYLLCLLLYMFFSNKRCAIRSCTVAGKLLTKQ